MAWETDGDTVQGREDRRAIKAAAKVVVDPRGFRGLPNGWVAIMAALNAFDAVYTNPVPAEDVDVPMKTQCNNALKAVEGFGDSTNKGRRLRRYIRQLYMRLTNGGDS